MATKRGRVSRLLGAEWEPLDAPLRCKVEAVGKSISGKKETKLGKGMLIRFVEEVVDQAVAALELPSSEPAAEAAEPAGLDKECKTTVVWWQRRAPQAYPLSPKSDEVYGLENPKYQLYMSMQECNKEI